MLSSLPLFLCFLLIYYIYISLYLITFLKSLIWFMSLFFSSRCMLDLKLSDLCAHVHMKKEMAPQRKP